MKDCVRAGADRCDQLGNIRISVRMSYNRVMAPRDTCDLLCLDLPKAEAIRNALPSQAELDAASDPFKALTDPTRLAILLALADGGTCCVCDLSWIVGRDEKLVSHHVRLLKSLGALRSHRDGRMVMYELKPLGAALVAAAAVFGEQTT
ncbi:MAG: metalloregulator ArsR/SmtB family transcription factor [Candidatus Limnocylindrales bacterium]